MQLGISDEAVRSEPRASTSCMTEPDDAVTSGTA